MTIANEIQTHIADAMRAKDGARLLALRNLKAALTNELVALKRASSETLTDEEAQAVIRRLVKQRKDSIEQFRRGNREELAAAEEAELRVLELYLPQMMSEDEIKKIAETKRAELGKTDLPASGASAGGQTSKSKMGILIGAVIKETKGRADGALVKKIVEELLS